MFEESDRDYEELTYALQRDESIDHRDVPLGEKFEKKLYAPAKISCLAKRALLIE